MALALVASIPKGAFLNALGLCFGIKWDSHCLISALHTEKALGWSSAPSTFHVGLGLYPDYDA